MVLFCFILFYYFILKLPVHISLPLTIVADVVYLGDDQMSVSEYNEKNISPISVRNGLGWGDLGRVRE